MGLDGEEIEKCMKYKEIGTFYEKELPKTNQTEFRVEEVIRKKVIDSAWNGKVVIILSTV